jgi:inner membrane protein involved in colicin E2 resistance
MLRPALLRQSRVAAPSAMLVAEAIFLVIDRKVWRYNLGAETYRLIDLVVMLALVMFLTCRVNWYELKLGERAAAGQNA